MLATLHLAPLRLSTTKPTATTHKRVREEKATHREGESPSKPTRQSKRIRGLLPTGVKREELEQQQDEEVEYYSPRKRTEQLTDESYANRMERYCTLNFPLAKKERARAYYLKLQRYIAIPLAPNRAQHQHLGIAHADSADNAALSATFTVRGSTGRMYTVTIEETPKCTCPYVRYWMTSSMYLGRMWRVSAFYQRHWLLQ